MSDNRIVTPQVVQLVDDYANRELEQARRYDNRQPLDESGIYSLQMLAAKIYALGYNDGENVAAHRERGAHLRSHEARTEAVS